MWEDCHSLKKELFINTDVTKKVQPPTNMKFESWLSTFHYFGDLSNDDKK